MAARTARPADHPMALRLPAVRLKHVWLVLPLAFAFAYASAIPITHTDFYYHLLLGQIAAEQGGWLWHEVVTYAPPREPLLNLPWLSQAAYHALVRLGGFELVSLIHAALVVATFLGVQRLAMRLGAGPRLAAACVLLALMLSATNLAVRPQSMALPLFVGLLFALETAPLRWLWLIVASLTTLWTNLHGSFVLAPLLVAIYLLGALIETRSWRSTRASALGVSLLAAASATLFNPLGSSAYRYALAISDNQTIRSFIQEWQPPSPSTLLGALFFTSLPLAVAGFWVARARLRPTHWLLLGSLLALALTAQRNVVWWALALAPLLACHLGRWSTAHGSNGGGRRVTMDDSAHTDRPSALSAVLLVAVIGIASLGLPWIKAQHPLLAPELRSVLDPRRPEGLAAYMERAGLHGRVIARMEWGGYLAWRLWPSTRLFLDARIEQHPETVWQDYFAIMSAQPNWSDLVDRYGTDYLAVDPAYAPRLAEALLASNRWRELYQDPQVKLFGRSQNGA